MVIGIAANLDNLDFSFQSSAQAFALIAVFSSYIVVVARKQHDENCWTYYKETLQGRAIDFISISRQTF